VGGPFGAVDADGFVAAGGLLAAEGDLGDGGDPAGAVLVEPGVLSALGGIGMSQDDVQRQRSLSSGRVTQEAGARWRAGPGSEFNGAAGYLVLRA